MECIGAVDSCLVSFFCKKKGSVGTLLINHSIVSLFHRILLEQYANASQNSLVKCALIVLDLFPGELMEFGVNVDHFEGLLHRLPILQSIVNLLSAIQNITQFRTGHDLCILFLFFFKIFSKLSRCKILCTKKFGKHPRNVWKNSKIVIVLWINSANAKRNTTTHCDD